MPPLSEPELQNFFQSLDGLVKAKVTLASNQGSDARRRDIEKTNGAQDMDDQKQDSPWDQPIHRLFWRWENFYHDCSTTPAGGI
jgi:hypothetical protein